MQDFQIMPENQCNQDGKKAKIEKLNKGCYNILYPIGKGGFGKVWKV